MEPNSVDQTLTDHTHTPEARDEERSRLADDVAEFLATGGKIKEVPKDFRADPPRKPQSNYGRNSI